MSLRANLHFEINSLCIQYHPLFQYLTIGRPRLMRKLCHEIMGHRLVQNRDLVFSRSDACSVMLLVQLGIDNLMPMRSFQHPMYQIARTRSDDEFVKVMNSQFLWGSSTKSQMSSNGSQSLME